MNWWQSYFDETYVRRLTIDTEQTVAEVLMLRDLIGDPPLDILDVACGQGRHSIALAQGGYHVIGLDTSSTLLDLARSAAAQRGVALEFVEGDMRAIPYVECFDGILNMNTAFGYFADESENQQALEGIARALKPGGRLVMELANRDRIVANYRPTDWHELPDGTVVWVRRQFDPVRGINSVTSRWRAPDGSVDEREHHVRIYTPTELDGMLRRAGLQPTAWFGSTELHALTIASPRIVVVAARPV